MDLLTIVFQTMVRSRIPQDLNCSDVRHDLNSSEVQKQRKSDFHAQLHDEALLIKKHGQSLNNYMLMAPFC